MKKYKEDVEIFIPNKKIGDKLPFAAKEAYNLLRTNISFSLNKKEGRGNIVGIVSAEPQDGKSFTSLNLAYTLAADNNKVVLIDGDMRKPTIDKYFEIDNVPGLSDIFTNPTKEYPIHKSVLTEKMDLICCGTIPPNPSQLLSSEEMKNILDNLSSKYDYVVIDLPPINVVADSLGASKYFDGIIVVSRHNKTRKKDLQEAIRQLTFVQAKILGIVYNGYAREGKYYYRRKKNNYYYEEKNKGEKE